MSDPSGTNSAESFKPYVPASVRDMPEFTTQAVLVGVLLGIVFGASSLYLVLKVGITVSASIPVAVLSITLFRYFSRSFGFRSTTILENNVVQTTGSAGESIAFGVGVTMPALLLIGYDMGLLRVMVVAVLGGLLGILMMIPLRRAFIVQLHGKPGEAGKLLYPEGTACAQVLISGEKGGTSGLTVFVGFGLAFVHKFLTEGMNLLKTTVSLPLTGFSRVAAVSSDMASELLGVGYIIGVRTAAVMMAGAVLGFLVLLPTVGLNAPGDATPGSLYNDYLKTIGAGCVAAAGVISMFRTLPMIYRSARSGLSNLRKGTGTNASGPGETEKKRTEDDLSMRFVLLGCLLLLVALTLFLLPEVGAGGAVLGGLLVLLFGFLFVTVSSRLTGEIGSSSNPISGMTVGTLLMTCLIFLACGMTSRTDAVLALSIGGVVCIAASNGGTTSQDLKTGFLVGGTPRWQQYAILIGALTSALVIGATLLLFNEAGTVFTRRNLPPINLSNFQVPGEAKSRFAALAEEMEYDGTKYRIWRAEDEAFPSDRARVAVAAAVFARPEVTLAATLAYLTDPTRALVEVKGGKYLVDERGQVCFRIDPTITGDQKRREKYEPLNLPDFTMNARDLATIKATVSLKDDSGWLRVYRYWDHSKETRKATNDEEKADPEKPKKYVGDYAAVADGFYLLDESGKIAYRDDGTPVALKFEAPKTQVMGIIIKGLLGGTLKWTLVLIGAFIAITLELCGISSLAFAVGVYIPMQYSAPIFLGGLVRWTVDAIMARKAQAALDPSADAETRAAAEVKAIAESESSPGVLLASGLIAGGSLAGVLGAFLDLFGVRDAIDFGKPVKDLYSVPVGLGLDVGAMIALPIMAALAIVLVLTGTGYLFKQPREKEAANSGTGTV